MSTTDTIEMSLSGWMYLIYFIMGLLNELRLLKKSNICRHLKYSSICDQLLVGEKKQQPWVSIKVETLYRVPVCR